MNSTNILTEEDVSVTDRYDVFVCPLTEMQILADIRKSLAENAGLVVVSGCVQLQKMQLAYAIAREKKNTLIITYDEVQARKLYEYMQLFEPEAILYPAKDLFFEGADIHGGALLAERVRAIRQISEGKRSTVIASVTGCMDYIVGMGEFRADVFSISLGDEMSLDALVGRLVEMGYERCDQVEMPGRFSVRGGIIDLFSLTEDLPWRIEFWGDGVDSIRSFNIENQRSVENLESVKVYPASDRGDAAVLIDFFCDEGDLCILEEPAKIIENARKFSDGYLQSMFVKKNHTGDIYTADKLVEALNTREVLALSAFDSAGDGWKIASRHTVNCREVLSYNGSFNTLVSELKKYKDEKYRVLYLSISRTRAKRLAEDLLQEGLNAFFSDDRSRKIRPGEIMATAGSAAAGFEYPTQRFLMITEMDVFGQIKVKKRKKKRTDGMPVKDFTELSIGDYVIHENHGFGVYRGIESIKKDGVVKDYIKLEYANGGYLYVLATQLDSIQKYTPGEENRQIKLNSLGDGSWNRTRARVRKAVRDIAKELVQLYAARQEKKGFACGADTEWQREFEETFPYEETEDQLLAIEDTKRDMESDKIMDRLICGDVGYGKTEIAVRAAFKAVQEGLQVAVLAPTTILVQQHYNTFSERMSPYPVNIGMLSRFRTQTQQKHTLKELSSGHIDIVIGTHRLLSKDVRFKRLGLLIVDEEQRFGVTHKEKIKKMKENVDVLTLTATPIPRTLHMSLIGIRDLSVLEEPPQDRKAVQTYVMEYDEESVREALSRELSRDGQVYFIYNNTRDIDAMAQYIESLVPGASVAYAHGKMKERELELIMYDFIEGRIDILVSTTIVETGLDIPNVNTIIIYDADRMGLSQLYQLRGRVGRTNRQAYAFLFYRKGKFIKEIAEKRLSAIRDFTELGSGIKIAMKDLEIRGAGNLLGAQQHGHMEAVGYEMYCRMLSEAIREERGETVRESFDTTLDLQVNAYIPDTYISNELQKLDIYKRIAEIKNNNDYEDMLEELIDRFGEPPKLVQDLLLVALVKATAHNVYMTEVRQKKDLIKMTMHPTAKLEPRCIPFIVAKYSSQLTFSKEKDVVFVLKILDIKKKTPRDVLIEIRNFLEEFLPYIMAE